MGLDLPPPQKLRLSVGHDEFEEWKGDKVEKKSSLSSNSNSYHKSEGYQSHPESSDKEETRQTRHRPEISRRGSYVYVKRRVKIRLKWNQKYLK